MAEKQRTPPPPRKYKRTGSFIEPPPPQINPFYQPEYSNEMINISFGEAVKLVIGSYTLAPLRLILILPLLLAIWLYMKFIIRGYNPNSGEPLPADKREALLPARYLVRAVLFVWGFYHINEKGAPAAPKDAPIVVANHISWFDPMLVASLVLPAFVSRKENENIPIVGTALIAVQGILVDRNSPTSRKDVSNKIQEYANSNGKRPQLAIFPEGTCTNQKSLISFKPGAFMAGKPVQPVAIKYPFVYYDCCWVNGVNAGLQGWRSLCQLIHFAEVDWLPVYKPSEAEQKDPNLFAANVRAEMAQHMNIPITEHSFEDVKLGMQAIDLHLSPESVAQVEFKAIKEMWSMSEDDLSSLLKKFSAMAGDDQTITQQEFGKALGLPANSPYVERVFYLMDKNDDGKVNFREYLSGIAFVSRKMGVTETIKFSFSIFDQNGDGKIEESELYSMITLPFPNLTKEDVSKLFKKADLDQDGFISFDDFKHFLEKNPEYYSMLDFYFEEKKSAETQAPNEKSDK